MIGTQLSNLSNCMTILSYTPSLLHSIPLSFHDRNVNETNSMTATRVGLKKSAATCVRGSLLRVASSPGQLLHDSHFTGIVRANQVLMYVIFYY